MILQIFPTILITEKNTLLYTFAENDYVLCVNKNKLLQRQDSLGPYYYF